MQKYLARQLTRSVVAARTLAPTPLAARNAFLTILARLLIQRSTSILTANRRDFARLPKDYALADRLSLTKDRLHNMAESLHAVKKLADPLGRTLERRQLPSGLHLSKISVPLGVVGIIYEARPNVTIEVVSLMMKSGNAVVLRGGRDAYESNKALVKCVHAALRKHRVPTDAVLLLNPYDRAASDALLTADRYLDLLIPRGSNKLIRYVREHATVPTIETGAGVCHIYVERSANIAMTARIIYNAKTRRPSVCNALDTVVVDRALVAQLSTIIAPLAKNGVIVYADTPAYRALAHAYPKHLLKRATAKDFGKEFLSLALSIKTVRNFKEAVTFVQAHTSKHSEGIITQNKKRAAEYLTRIDAAAVYHNASIAFTDGFEFGLGAEIGISTQKLHARGPMGLKELTSYKWIVKGRGQTRP